MARLPWPPFDEKNSETCHEYIEGQLGNAFRVNWVDLDNEEANARREECERRKDQKGTVDQPEERWVRMPCKNIAPGLALRGMGGLNKFFA